MKIRQVVIGLIGLISLGIAFGVGRYFRPIPLVKHDWDLYVSSDPKTTGHCLVSSPIQLMSYTNDRVRWLSEDNKYRVDFTSITTPIPPDPITHQPYTQESPLEPSADHVPFEKGSPTRYYNVHQKENYYYYQIVDQSTGNPCKVATEDRDTGLNVKR
jgi:hypothetical protein